MPRVLIPSDNRDFVAQLAAAYRQRGWEVATGTFNFALRTAAYDLVHLQWPEELSGWEPPSEKRIGELAALLEAWSAQARLLLTVHNLYPHRQGDDPAYRKLLEVFYAKVPHIAHFTEASRAAVLREFPMAAKQQHLVTGYFSFDSLLPAHRDRAAARQRLGIEPGEFVVLSFGALREWAEVALLREGFAGARVEKKRLLMAGRYQEFGPVWKQRWRRWSWSAWLRRMNAVVVPGFVPDEEVHRILDAADVVVVPRAHALNSGLPGLAATFGLPFILPETPAFAEIAASSRNPLYQAGSAESLAKAIEKASTLDREKVAAENRALAERWNWDRLVAAGIEAVGSSR